MTALVNAYRKERKTIFRLARTPGADSRCIHELRVAIKETRSLLRLATTTKKGFHAAPVERFLHPLFKRAGKVREAQIEIEYARQCGLPESGHYITELKGRLVGAERDFTRLHRGVIGNRFRVHAKKAEKALKQIDQHQVHKYLKGEVRKLNAMLDEDLQHEVLLHRLRKQVKKTLFIAKLIRCHKTAGRTFEHLNKFQELLGTWHDLQLTSDQLAVAISLHQPGDSSQKILLNALQETIDKKAEVYVRSIRAGLTLGHEDLLKNLT